MKNKKFDCVKMKHDIQQQLRKEFEGLTEEEQWAITEKRILADPILGPFWKNARKVQLRDSDPETTPQNQDTESKPNTP